MIHKNILLILFTIITLITAYWIWVYRAPECQVLIEKKELVG